MQIGRLAIVGLGLMGGSLGLAARRRGAVRCVSAYARRAQTREAALARGVADEVHGSVRQAVAGCDLAVFCVPVLAIPDLVAEAGPALPDGCVVTDVGSTKQELHRRIPPLLVGAAARYVGSHPIAGSDETGMEAAREDLYEGAVTVVTDREGVEADVLRVGGFWESVGSRTVRMDPAEHDAVMAKTSHLPHLVAALLVRGALGSDAGAAAFCGSGFRDATRIAAGSEDVWHDIVKTNGAAIGAELGLLARSIAGLKVMVDSGDFEGIRALLAECRQLREGLGRGRR